MHGAGDPAERAARRHPPCVGRAAHGPGKLSAIPFLQQIRVVLLAVQDDVTAVQAQQRGGGRALVVSPGDSLWQFHRPRTNAVVPLRVGPPTVAHLDRAAPGGRRRATGARADGLCHAAGAQRGRALGAVGLCGCE